MGLGISGGNSSNGVYNTNQNQAVPSTGLVLQTRAPAPTPQQQIQQQTAIHSGNVTAADVSLHDANGNPYTVTNPLPIFITSAPASTSLDHYYFHEVTAIAASTLTTVLTYSVPVGFNYHLMRFTYDGENIAKYEVYVNGDILDRARTHFGAALSGQFDFSISQEKGILFPENTILQLKVIHYRPSLSSFSSRIQGILESM